MTSVQEIAEQIEKLRGEGEKLIVAALNPLFDQHPCVKTVSFLNGDTYNDEGYSMPSKRARGYDIVVVNDVDPYDLDDLTEEEKEQWTAASTDFENFYNAHLTTLIRLFGYPTEIEFYRARVNGSINVNVYEGEY